MGLCAILGVCPIVDIGPVWVCHILGISYSGVCHIVGDMSYNGGMSYSWGKSYSVAMSYSGVCPVMVVCPIVGAITIKRTVIYIIFSSTFNEGCQRVSSRIKWN